MVDLSVLSFSGVCTHQNGFNNFTSGPFVINTFAVLFYYIIDQLLYIFSILTYRIGNSNQYNIFIA